MKKFKLTKGRERELKICEYFINPNWKDFKSLMWNKDSSINLITQTGRIVKAIEDKEGVSAEEGYFSITERGKKNIRVADIKRFLNLWYGRVLACQGGEFGLVELWDKAFGLPPQEVIEYTANKICGGQHKKQILEIYGKTE
jgi:hypothetical protein